MSDIHEVGGAFELRAEIAEYRDKLAEAERQGDHAMVAKHKWMIERREETLKDLLRITEERLRPRRADK